MERPRQGEALKHMAPPDSIATGAGHHAVAAAQRIRRLDPVPHYLVGMLLVFRIQRVEKLILMKSEKKMQDHRGQPPSYSGLTLEVPDFIVAPRRFIGPLGGSIPLRPADSSALWQAPCLCSPL